jgi:hypothetical protein
LRPPSPALVVDGISRMFQNIPGEKAKPFQGLRTHDCNSATTKRRDGDRGAAGRCFSHAPQHTAAAVQRRRWAPPTLGPRSVAAAPAPPDDGRLPVGGESGPAGRRRRSVRMLCPHCMAAGAASCCFVFRFSPSRPHRSM